VANEKAPLSGAFSNLSNYKPELRKNSNFLFSEDRRAPSENVQNKIHTFDPRLIIPIFFNMTQNT